MSRNHHVVPYGDKWAVRKEGNTKVSGIYDTKRAAVSNARHVASSTSSEVVIHCSDGRILSKDAYGVDSCPPRRCRNSF